MTFKNAEFCVFQKSNAYLLILIETIKIDLCLAVVSQFLYLQPSDSQMFGEPIYIFA